MHPTFSRTHEGSHERKLCGWQPIRSPANLAYRVHRTGRKIAKSLVGMTEDPMEAPDHHEYELLAPKLPKIHPKMT